MVQSHPLEAVANIVTGAEARIPEDSYRVNDRALRHTVDGTGGDAGDTGSVIAAIIQLIAVKRGAIMALNGSVLVSASVDTIPDPASKFDTVPVDPAVDNIDVHSK